MNLHVEGDAGWVSHCAEDFLIAKEGSAGGPADTKPREDALCCNVRNLFIFSSVNPE